MDPRLTKAERAERDRKVDAYAERVRTSYEFKLARLFMSDDGLVVTPNGVWDVSIDADGEEATQLTPEMLYEKVLHRARARAEDQIQRFSFHTAEDLRDNRTGVWAYKSHQTYYHERARVHYYLEDGRTACGKYRGPHDGVTFTEEERQAQLESRDVSEDRFPWRWDSIKREGEWVRRRRQAVCQACLRAMGAKDGGVMEPMDS